ncbi:MAG: gliding motility-associated C-terminal domain-containing protein, partial [Bacteroidota bacterium]|nr:gliding motility-associated C-terminal domain-containing protein [Bacteroidota bacterium]
ICVFSMDMYSQTEDSVCCSNNFQASLTNDSIVQLWIIPPFENNYNGYVEKKQTSLGNVWQRLEITYTQLKDNNAFDTLRYDCRDTIIYRLVEYSSIEPTPLYISTEKQFIVGDIEIPDMPLNALVSIDDNQNLTLFFSYSISEYVLGYVICKGNPCISLDTLWGQNNTTYTCNSCDIEQISELAVMSFDTCMNTSLRSDKINNIVLKVERQDCSEQINLSWNEYINMPSGLNNYEVHLLKNNDEVLLSTQYNSATVDISEYNGELSFYIKAVGNNSSFFSNSNRVPLNQTATDTLKFMRWQNASVNFDNKSVTLQIEVDNSIPVEAYKLYRKEEGKDYVFVKKIAYTGENTLNIEDNLNKEATNKIYYYYLQAPDRCGNTYTSSPICTTFKANVEQINTTTNRITWTSFNLFPVARYDIYRYEQGDLLPIKIGESVINSFNDIHGGLISYADKLYYYAVAIENNGEQRNANSSHSYLKYETLFFIPNAFDPTESNITEISTFKPNISHIRKDSYLFTIYNRWGTNVFSTDDIEEGWNGTYKGKMCETGVYVYKVRYINSSGKMENHSGTFMLYN